MDYTKPFIGDPDQHIQEPADFWTERVERRYRDVAPRVVNFPLGGECWIYDGGDYLWPLGLEVAGGQNYSQYSWHGSSYDSIRPGCYDAAARIKDMSLDGIDAAAIFPSVGMKIRSPMAVRDPGFGMALVRAYNDGIWEWCAEGGLDRLIPLAIIPGFGLESALSELERVTAKGFHGVYITTFPNGSDEPDPVDDQLWSRCQEAGLVVNVHVSLARGDIPAVGASKEEAWDPDDAIRFMNRRARGVLSGRAGVAIIKTLSDLATTGVFERFPLLTVASVETGVGWLPFFLEQIDDNWKRHRFWANGPSLPMLPSEYIRRNVMATMQIDRVGVRLRNDIGVRNIMWSSDYPHTGMDWPNSRWVIDMEFDGVSDEEKRQMIGLNFARAYALEPDAYNRVPAVMASD